MTITQTVDIPASRRLTIDVPREVPAGRTILAFTPVPESKWVNPLLGIAKAKGAKLTLERFMELQQEEIELENENDRRLWDNK